jgi:hypothetical protein
LENFFGKLFEKLDGIQFTLDMILERSSLHQSTESVCTPPKKFKPHPKLIGEDIVVVGGSSPTQSQSPTNQVRSPLVMFSDYCMFWALITNPNRCNVPYFVVLLSFYSARQFHLTRGDP